MTATERMPVVGTEVVDTADERWAGDDEAWYKAAADYAVAKLGPGEERVCLVIGSPMQEVRRLDERNWSVTFVDIRESPTWKMEFAAAFYRMDATDLRFADNSFDAVSSTCVLCHAGLGRYGDPVKPNGDVLMMREIARVLKPGGRAAIMAGPTLPESALPHSVVFGNVHRIYRVDDVVTMATEAGLECLDVTVAVDDAWDTERLLSTDADGVTTIKYCYLSLLLRKPA